MKNDASSTNSALEIKQILLSSTASIEKQIKQRQAMIEEFTHFMEQMPIKPTKQFIKDTP